MSNYAPGTESDPRAPWNQIEEACAHKGGSLDQCPACNSGTCDQCQSGTIACAKDGREAPLCFDCADFMQVCEECRVPRELLRENRCGDCFNELCIDSDKPPECWPD